MSNELIITYPEFEVLHSFTPTLGSADSSYPATLAADFSNGDVCAKPSLSTAGSDAWLWNFSSAQRLDGIWFWHNGDPGIVFHFQMNATNSWGSPTVDVTLTAPAKHKLGFTFKAFIDLTLATGYSNAGKQYFRVVFPTNTSTSAKPGIKIQGFSQFTRLTRGIRPALYNPHMQSAISLTTAYGHEWVYKLKAVQQAALIQTKPSAADLALLRTWQEANGRGVTCIALNTDSTFGLPTQGLIGRITSVSGNTTQYEDGRVIQVFEQRLQNESPYLNTVDIGFRELTAGLPEWT